MSAAAGQAASGAGGDGEMMMWVQGVFKGAALAAFGLLAACADAAPPTALASGQAPRNQCDAQAAQSLVGQTWGASTLQQALAAAGADEARLLHPDSVITKEFKKGRLNVVVDNGGRIVRVYCG